MDLRSKVNGLGVCAGMAALLAAVTTLTLPSVDARAWDSASFARADDSTGGPQQDPPPEAEKAEGEKKEESEEGKLQLDPELKRRIDEFMEQHQDSVQQAPPVVEPQKPPRRTPPTRTRVPRATPPEPGAPTEGMEPSPAEVAAPEPAAPGDTTPLDIPPSDDSTPPEQRKYRFSIKDGTYEQLVEGFSRQTGLGVLGEAPKDGKVTFVSTQELTFDQALNRVRMLLFNYKPLEPYWIELEERHLKVIRVNDFYRLIPRDRMFPSVDSFRAANLHDEELALVVYRPQSGSLADLTIVRDWLPDYVRVSPMEERNAVTIFALVKDIEKCLELIDFVGAIGGFDPRTLERIEIRYILPSEAITKLEALMVLDGRSGARGAVRSSAPRGPKDAAAPAPPPLAPMAEPEVSLLPDDAQGVLIVRAMQDKIGEIKQLLPYIDVDTSLPYTPVVIPVQHADPFALVETIQQILAAYAQPGGEAAQGAPPPSAPPAATGPRRRGAARPGGRGSPSLPSGKVLLIVHPSQSAIIAVGAEADVQNVRGLVAQFDVGRIGPIAIELAHAQATELTTTLTLVLGAPSVSKGGKAAVEQFSVVPDPSDRVLWFSGSEQDLEKVRELVAMLDVPAPSIALHVIRLHRQRASFVADMLRQFESMDVAPPQVAPTAPPSGGGRPRASKVRGQTVTASKFTPDDDHNVLYVVCSDVELQGYLGFIERLEGAVDPSPTYQRVPLQHVDAETVIEQLTAMIGGPGGRAEDVRYVPAGAVLLVVGASEDVLKDIEAIVAEFDRPVEMEQRTFAIVYADPAEVKTAVETLLGDGAAGGAVPPRGPRRAPRPDAKGAPTVAPSISPSMTIYQIDNRLIVHAAASVMDDVAALIAELDVSRSAATETRVYEGFAPETDIAAISETLTSVFAGASVERPHRGPKGAPAAGPPAEGPRFLPMADVGKLMVIAEPALFPRIEEMVDLWRGRGDVTPIELAMIDVTYADAAMVVEQIIPLLDMQVRRLVMEGRLAAIGEVSSAAPKAAPPAPGGGGRRRVSPSGEASSQYHISADEWGSRIVIGAPRAVIDYARDLIARFDTPQDQADVIVRTIALENAASTEMVRAVREMMGAPSRAPRRSAAAKGAPATSELEAAPPLVIVEAPTSGSVVLRGLSQDVEEASAWIKQLDVPSARGRRIKVYEVLYADIKTLATLILNVVDQPAAPPVAGAAPGKPPQPRPRSGAQEASSEEEDVFEITKTWFGQDMYIQADLFARTMIVATTEAKMAEIDALMAQFDRNEPGLVAPSVPKFTFALKHASATDAEFALETVLEQLWEPRDKLPDVEAAFWGDYLIISYPDKSRFSDIEAMIREYVDVISPDELVVKQRTFAPPPGVSPSDFAEWMRRTHPEITIDVVDVSTLQDNTFNLERVRPQPPSNLERIRPESPSRTSGCVLPLAFSRMVDALVAGASGQNDPRRGDKREDQTADPPPNEESEPPADQESQPPPGEPVEPVTNEQEEPPVQSVAPVAPVRVPPASGPDMLGAVGRSVLDADKAVPSMGRTGGRSSPSLSGEGEKLTLYVNNDTGAIEVKGRVGVLDEIKDWMKEYKEQFQDWEPPPDIRIVRMRYIDVYSATEVLEEMFNATRQQRQFVEQQQRMAQQQIRQQQAQQRQQQQQQQRQQPEKPQPGQQPGQPQRPGQPGQPQQPEVQVPQLPPTTVRVFPNPRDRTLILRADTNQYPAIFELLATIDQPKPINSEMRIFRLKKLNAADVEALLEEMLGLGGQRARRSAPTQAQGQQAGRRQARTTPARQAEADGEGLPETIMETTNTGSLLGVDAEDIKLSSNEQANTIIAVGPLAALDYIGRTIDRLESEELFERMTKYYELQYADVDDVVDYLDNHFGEGEGGAGGRPGRKGGGAPSALNTPSFVPYARLNMLTVMATEEQLTEIDALIQRLDVSSGQEQWEHITLTHADAADVADKLTQMFVGGGGGGGVVVGGAERPRGGRGGARGGTGAVKFIGDEGGRMVLYAAPEKLRESILQAVAKLEAAAEDRSILRVIALTYATPSKVAEAIDAAYGGGGGRARAGGRGGARPAATGGSSRFTITPDDATKRLFVFADDGMYPQIESLAKSLDQPGTIGFEFRIYPMKYADAREVYTLLTKLITDYMRQQPRGAAEREAFSVEVNDRTNSLVVLGSPVVFGFVEQNLATIDTPANAASPPTFLIRSLVNADAAEVAQTINRLWADPARQRGQPGGPQQLMAEANRALNMLIVRGPQDQIEEIRREVLDPLEKEGGATLLTEAITLKYADPEAVADLINVIFEDKKRAFQGLGNVGRTMPLQFTVVVTPDIHTRQVVVQAGKENMELVKARIAELDREDVASSTATTVRIYRPQFADSGAVADIINAWGRTRPTTGGARGKTGGATGAVQATSEPTTHAVVVTTTESNHVIIADLLERLDTESNFATEIQRIQLKNADAELLAKSLQETLRADAASQRGGKPAQVIAEPGTNSLIVTGTRLQLADVLPLIEALDIPAVGDQQRDVRVITLLYADAKELQTVMQDYLRKKGGRGGAGGELAGDMRISALDQSNAIVISGDKEEVEQLEATIRAMDREGEKGSIPQIIPLRFARVGQILPTLQEMFAEQRGGGRRGQTPPIILANEAGNFLIVSAGVSDIAAIEGIVARLDDETIPADKFLRIVQVAAGNNVTDLAEQVEESVNESGRAMARGGDVRSITATPNPRTGSIVISGDPSLGAQAEDLIHSLEGMGPPGGTAMRIINLDQLPAEEVQRLIERLQGRDSGERRSRTPARRSSSGTSGTRRPSTPSPGARRVP